MMLITSFFFFFFFFTTGECISKTRAPRTFQQSLFKKEELPYLNVSKLGTFAVYDFFDCTFECLSNPLCLSINVAALRGADGKLWCKLLSSDKYKDASQYGGNKSSHHFSVGCARIHSLFRVLLSKWNCFWFWRVMFIWDISLKPR